MTAIFVLMIVIGTLGLLAQCQSKGNSKDKKED